MLKLKIGKKKPRNIIFKISKQSWGVRKVKSANGSLTNYKIIIKLENRKQEMQIWEK